jgi:hypothetical protein
LYKKNDMFKGPTQKPMRLAHDGPWKKIGPGGQSFF